MKFMDKIERKLGRYAIPNLSVYLICCMIIGYVISLVAPEMFVLLTLEPMAIMQGQVWRLVTWVLIPPSSFDFFTIIMLFVYYQIGKSLESSIGTFRYNVFMFGGVVCTAVLSMVVYWVGLAMGKNLLFVYGPSMYYTCLTIYMAIAVLYPDMHLYLYFLIPIRMKWMLILYIVFTAIDFINGGLGVRVAILAAMLNFVIFILTNRRVNRIHPAEIKRRQMYRKQVKEAASQAQTAAGTTRHKCAVCGRTEKDGDDLVFRYCTKCNGTYEYCQEHLFTHTHVQ